MATTTELRKLVSGLSDEAIAELRSAWPKIGGDGAFADLAELLPGLVSEYGNAAAAIAKEWYSDYRDAMKVAGSFKPLTGKEQERAAKDLAGWIDTLLKDDKTERDTVFKWMAGGVQRRVTDSARDTVAYNTSRDGKALGWKREAEPGACPFCVMLTTRDVLYKSEDTADFGSHDNCFPAGVMVTGPSTEVGYRRWYEGEIVVVRFANGEQLPVTPNHPVLTPQGWIAADGLRVGQNVFQRANISSAPLRVPYEDDVPSAIEDVWGAGGMNGFRSVPVAAEDFHGDVGRRESDVDVVTADGFFAGMRNAAHGEQGADRVGSGAGSATVLNTFAAFGDGLLPILGSPFLTDCGMGGLGIGATLCRRHSARSDGSSFACTTGLDSDAAKPARDGGTRGVVASSHRENAFSGHVVLDQAGRGVVDFTDGSGFFGSAGDDAMSVERGADTVAGVSAEDACDLVERLAGGVELLRIVEVGRREVSCHVYNLQTVEGWYAANGVIVHNCNCNARPEFGGEAKKVREYVPSERNVSDADRARVRRWIKDNL